MEYSGAVSTRLSRADASRAIKTFLNPDRRGELVLPSNWKDHFVSSESTAERRIAVQRATEERAAVRKRHLDAQASPLIGAEDRIRLWEQLHGLHLPVDPAHRLVRVIAQQTALSVQQIQDEQRRRAMPRDAQPTQATEAASS